MQMPYNFSFRNLSEFTITPRPHTRGAYEKETLEIQAEWQIAFVKHWGNTNPMLREIGLYYVTWRRHGFRDCDWGWSLLDPTEPFEV
jgi:hypothetical protein